MTDVVRAPSGPVEGLYEDYCGLVEDLEGKSSSGMSALNRSYHKVILIAAASSLEAQIKELIKDVFCKHGRDEIAAFVGKRVMARGYHTLFDWDRERAKSFFSSFGPDCAKHFDELLRTDSVFAAQHAAFMRIGSLRNQLVHKDYANFALEHTPRELIEMYREAAEFPNRFENIIFPQKD